MIEAQMGKTGVFNRFSKTAARATGQPMAFVIAALIVVFWALTGYPSSLA